MFRSAAGLLLVTSFLFGQDGGLDRALSREAFKQMSPAGVLAAMETGPMISMAVRFTQPQRRAIAEYLTGKSFSDPIEVAASPKGMCANSPSTFSLPASGPTWNGLHVNSGYSSAGAVPCNVLLAFSVDGA